jgi:hypothetical protein
VSGVLLWQLRPHAPGLREGSIGEFVELGEAGHILDDDVAIGISKGLGFVRLNVAFGREWIVKSEGEGPEVSKEKGRMRRRAR